MWVNNLKAMQLHLCRLRFVTHGAGWKRGKYPANQALNFENWGSWDGPVILHFGIAKPFRLPSNSHKICAGVFTILAATSLFCASQLCWQCIDKIHIKDRLTVLELQQIFHLAGACGRHAPIGAGSFLGSLMLLASAMVQAVLYLLTSEQFHYGGPVKKALIKEYEKEMGARQLWGCLRPPHSIMLDHQIYDDANIEQPKIWCHVWVQKWEAKEQRTSKMGKVVSEKTADQGTHEEEIIPDCDEGEEHSGMDATDVKKLHEARRST